MYDHDPHAFNVYTSLPLHNLSLGTHTYTYAYISFSKGGGRHLLFHREKERV